MQSEVIAVLGEANRAIMGLLSRLSENSAKAVPKALSSSELKALSEKLAQVARRLDQVAPHQPKEQALQAVLSEYVVNLEKLKVVLGGAMEALGKHRDRLKKDLKHLSLARAWVETFRATNLS